MGKKIFAFVLAVLVLSLNVSAKEEPVVKFTDVRSQTQQFIEYYQSIKLTAEQEAIKEKALSSFPAPCCSEFSMATCCCPCNMAKSVWGLSAYLIAKKSQNADQVRALAQEWIQFIHPKGYDGKACQSGRCGAPFANDGCGGMNHNSVVY